MKLPGPLVAEPTPVTAVTVSAPPFGSLSKPPPSRLRTLGPLIGRFSSVLKLSSVAVGASLLTRTVKDFSVNSPEVESVARMTIV
ncbi:hypothetical protein Rcae01_06747 [Novipirellula caenicola]|uniref:Uncharacterized protein n=1 Tax=Novipirellula caenicola TaxID=1536901 RepID=A0ABP9W1G7_9BACT